MLRAMIFWWLWGPLKTLLDGLGSVWRRLGASGLRLGCVLEGYEGVLRPNWRVLESLGGALGWLWDVPGVVPGFRCVFFIFSLFF